MSTSATEYDVECKIKDRGVGILEENRRKIFEPLFTAKNHSEPFTSFELECYQ
jgi:signal transduction histidine kinase